VLLVLIGGFGVTRAGQDALKTQGQSDPPAKAAAAPKDERSSDAVGRLVLRAVEVVTGEPIEGVSIEYQGGFDGKLRRATVITGEDGTAAIEWAPGGRVHRLWITARKPGLVPIHVLWDDEQHPTRVPASKELRFEPGTTIGGIVKDEAGQPISGATVDVLLPATESEQKNYYFSLGTRRTDQQGRWRLDEAPRRLDGISASVTHPRYRRGYAVASHDLNGVSVLKKGLTITGRVVDGAGQPIRGARAVLGHDKWGTNPPTGTTDERGAFTLENCDAGPNIVTVHAEGYAPQISDVRVEERAAPVEVRLAEPGATIRGRVVDVQGKPVAGAFVAADTWRGHRTIEFRGSADKDGRFEWRSAPRDVVLYDFGQEGYMSSRHVPLTASDREQTVTLYPKLTISGRVTDAATGRPIETFRVVQGRRFEGQDRAYWSESAGAEGSDGRFTSQFGEPGAALLVRVEAPGYKPAESRPFRPGEGQQTADFALQPAAGLAAIVQLPDGTPVAGADVALATREQRLALESGRFERQANVPLFTTGPDGRFTFTPPDDKYLLIAVSDAGFADASSDELTKSSKLVLQPWGKIEGGVRIGARAGANQEVTFHSTRPNRGGLYVFDPGYRTRTDERGRFAFDRVIPGPGIVSRSLILEFPGGGSRHSPGWQEPVDVKPGQTALVKVGGRGRPVIGRIVLDGIPEVPVDWTQSEPATLTAPRNEQSRRDRLFVQYVSNIDKEGRFRIEDVPAGRYELGIPVYAMSGPRSLSTRRVIAQARVPVTIPEIPAGRSSEPLDLGTITARLLETLKAGDPAPDFSVRRIVGRGPDERITLGDYQGKLVLLDFWATWSRAGTVEVRAIKDIQATFGGDPRFAIISLSCDQTAEVAERHVKDNGLNWAQGFAGSLLSPVARSYKVREIPATFLIGPHGRILARNLRGAALKAAIAGALKDEALFQPRARDERPARFPVTRFEAAAAAPAQGPAEKPLAVVLDDSDEDFEEERPHRDTLRILREADQVAGATVTVSNLPEFNTCQTVGGIHGVAIDRERGRIYLCEMVADRVTALDFRGRRLWQTDGIDGGALAVDPRTGHLWCTAGKTFDGGETVVLDTSGREIASFSARGIDLAHDPKTDGFWLVGYGITKLSREGKVLFHKPEHGWAYTSVAVDPRDGSVWIVEREHPDVARSANRLWHLDSGGGVIKMWPLGEKLIFGVACDPKTGTAWVACLRSEILRFTADGRELPALPIKAVAVAVSPTTGRVWVTTETEVIELDAEGRPAIRSPLGPTSGQSWMAAY
jgi:protocatechuate 3,4-dioxygenase beta subunit/peroxiredoxin/DNA-binding beta-propeller fold protein YncE